MKRTTAIALAVLPALFVGAFVVAQPVPGGGLRFVSHNSEMAGTGTSVSPLGLITSCSSTQVLAWNGSSWACAANGLTNSAGNNVVPKSNGTNLVSSSITDDGTVATVPNADIRALFFGPEIVPAALPNGNTNNWSPTGAGLVVDTDTGTLSTTTRIGVQTNVNGSTVTGLAAPSANGRIVILENLGDGIQSPTSTLTLTHQDSNSTAANEWFIPGLRSCVLPVGGVAMAIYFTGHPHWFLISCYTNGSYQQVDTPQLNATAGTVSTITTQDNTLTGAVSPSALPSGSTDNWTFTGLSTSTEIHVTTNGAGSTLKGIVAQGNGKIRRLCNYGTGDLLLEHRTSSTSANQFWMPESTTFTVKSLGCVTLRDDTSLPGWVVTDADRSSTGILTSGSNITSSSSGVVTKWCGTNIFCNSVLTEDGTSFIVGVNVFTVTEASGNTSIAGNLTANGNTTLGDATGDAIVVNGNSIVLNAVTNGTATTTFDAVGYLSGTTQFRNTQWDDGKGNAIVYWGQAASAPAGSIFNANIDNTKIELKGTTNSIGKDTASVNSFTNGPTGVNLYGGTYFEYSDEFLYTPPSQNILVGDLNLNVLNSGTGTGFNAESVTDVAGGRADRFGELGLKTGTATAGGYSALTAERGYSLATGQNFTLEASVKWDTLSSSSNSVASEYVSIWGLTDNATSTPVANIVNGCYFAYDKGNVLTGNKNAGNVDAIECWCAAASTRTGYLINNTGNSDESFALGVGTIAAQTYHRYSIVTTAHTRAEFYRDGTKVCDINTNLPSTPLGVTFGMFPQAATGTGDRHFILDQATLKGTTAVRSP